MTVIGLDDTDSRTDGMCTTYVAARIAAALHEAGHVERVLLVRLNPAVEHKTRGNAALAVHTEVEPATARDVAAAHLDLAATDDPDTNPGVVVADADPDAVPDAVADFATHALRAHHALGDTVTLLDDLGYDTLTGGDGRGLVGALAAVGAWRAHDDWTYEAIAYRERERWGTERRVDHDALFDAAERAYPRAWDTVDATAGYPVCVPRTPCPVLYGIRGDDRETVERVADEGAAEPVARRQTFVTNQGTDAHLTPADSLAALQAGRAYRVDAVVASDPATVQGGHVFVDLADTPTPDSAGASTKAAPDGGQAPSTRRAAAYEPTKRFRDHVRALRPGDRVTVCGQVTDGTLNLEKFAVRDLVRTRETNPVCPECGNSMGSAGRDQGYRCRDCGTHRAGPETESLDRDLAVGWYEVPPVARRHVAKPLVRGGFDAPVHPER